MSYKRFLKYMPNGLTIMRLCLVIPTIWAIFNAYFLLALFCFMLAAISDGVDGWLARRYQWQSRFGSIADPLADKLLISGCLLALTYCSHFPVMLMALILLRDVVIVSGALLYHYWIGRYDMRPSWLSKLNTFLQFSLVAVFFIHIAGLLLLPKLLAGLTLLVALTTSLSLLHYVGLWGWLAIKAKRANYS